MNVEYRVNSFGVTGDCEYEDHFFEIDFFFTPDGMDHPYKVTYYECPVHSYLLGESDDVGDLVEVVLPIRSQAVADMAKQEGAGFVDFSSGWDIDKYLFDEDYPVDLEIVMKWIKYASNRHHLMRYLAQQGEVPMLFEDGSNSGYVYVIESTSGHYKIGMSKDPEKRLAQMKKGAAALEPFELTLNMSIWVDNMRLVESLLHKKFETSRVNGEWFTLDCDDLEFIKRLGHGIEVTVWEPDTLALFGIEQKQEVAA